MTRSILSKLLATPKDIASISRIFYLIDAPTTIQQWDIIIRDISSRFQPRMSILCYTIMRRKGVTPSKHTFPSLLKSFSKSNQKPFQLLPDIVKFGMSSDPFARNALISALFASGDVELARQVFDEIEQLDVVSWTAIMNGYSKSGLFIEGLKCFNEMRLKGVKVDAMSVVCALSAAAKLSKIWFGRSIHGLFIETGRFKRDVFIDTAIVDLYSKCGCCDDAGKYFDEMPRKNVVSWSALLAGYVQCNRYKDALVLFQNMLKENVRPNEFTFTCVLSACAGLGALDKGRWVHEYVGRYKLDMNSSVGASLINMYTKCGCLNEALLVFKKLSGKNVHAWTAMINGLAMHGDAIGSLNLFWEMLGNCILPNEVTFIAVLSACSHGGLVEEGRKLFLMMKEKYHLTPNIDHYSCMVDLLGRAGYLEEAKKLIEDMPIEPSAEVWAALLGACMIHKEFDLGEYIGKHLIKLQPNHSGSYALSANMYSRCQKWDSVAEIRKLMKERGLKKKTGCSWIEVNGSIHEFTAFDRSHSESHSLNEMMDGLTVQLTLAAYTPDCSSLEFDFFKKANNIKENTGTNHLFTLTTLHTTVSTDNTGGILIPALILHRLPKPFWPGIANEPNSLHTIHSVLNHSWSKRNFFLQLAKHIMIKRFNSNQNAGDFKRLHNKSIFYSQVSANIDHCNNEVFSSSEKIKGKIETLILYLYVINSPHQEMVVLYFFHGSSFFTQHLT